MTALRKPPAIPARIIADPSVKSGDPVVAGTRFPAETILAYPRAGRTDREIFEDYPTLPIDGVEAVIRWAKERHGADWRRTLREETR
jgi:uncharacterized protein (DUF433 family)